MSDKDVSFTINATDKTGAAFASVQKNLMRIGESTTKFTALASAGGYAISGLDGLGKAGQAAAAGIGMTTMAMSALGGPAGILLGVTAAVAGYAMASDKSTISTEEWSRRLAELQGNLVKVEGMRLAEKLAEANAELEKASSYSFFTSVFGDYDENKIAVIRNNITELNKKIAENQELQKAGITNTDAVRRAESELTKQREQLASAGRAVYEATRTPLEKLSTEHDRLNSLLRQGAIDEDTRSRAMLAAIQTYDATLQKAKMPQQKEDDQLARNLAGLEESMRTENERLILHYQDQQFIIEESFQAGLVTQQERYALLEGIEQEHHKKLLDIRYQGLSASDALAVAFREKDVKSAIKFGAQMTAGVATQNKDLFQLNKNLALANAAVNLPSAILSSFEKAGGYPWGIIPAAMMAATGLAQIQAINSASFGGGASAPSLAGAGGGGSTVNTVPVGAQGVQPIVGAQQAQAIPEVSITFTAGITDTASVRDLITRINEEYPNGVKIRTQ